MSGGLTAAPRPRPQWPSEITPPPAPDLPCLSDIGFRFRIAAELLCDFDYLRREQEATTGRWTERYRIHPKLIAEGLAFSRKVPGGN